MRRFLLVGLSLLLLAARPAAAAPDYAAIGRDAADKAIIPAYAAYHAQAVALDTAAQAFCAAPTAPGLEAVQAGFNATMDAWQRIQVIPFGPVDDMHRGQRVHFWPDSKGSGDRQLRQLLKDRKVEALEGPHMVFASVALQGLPALETLLFDGGAADKLLGGGEEATFRCRVVKALTVNLAVLGQELTDEWTAQDDGFRQAVVGAGGPGSPFPDHKQVASQVFNALYGHLEAVADVKLGKTLGADPGAARRQRAESWRAQRSLDNIIANLDGDRALFTAALAPALPAEAAKAVDAAFAEAIAAAKAAPRPMEPALETPEGWAALNALKAKVKAVVRALGDKAGPPLDLQVGFNALDGD